MRSKAKRVEQAILSCCLFIFFLACKQRVDGRPQVAGLIPNQETAIKVAEAVWLPIYGKKMYDEAPFNASLTENGNWLVLGSTYGKHGGGELMIILQPKDGKIIFVGRDPGK